MKDLQKVQPSVYGDTEGARWVKVQELAEVVGLSTKEVRREFSRETNGSRQTLEDDGLDFVPEHWAVRLLSAKLIGPAVEAILLRQKEAERIAREASPPPRDSMAVTSGDAFDKYDGGGD